MIKGWVGVYVFDGGLILRKDLHHYEPNISTNMTQNK